MGRQFRSPEISNDGATIANQIVLEDEIENLGAQALIEASQRTNDVVGDGTSTSTVLAQKIIQHGMKEIDSGKSLIGNHANVAHLSAV